MVGRMLGNRYCSRAWLLEKCATQPTETMLKALREGLVGLDAEMGEGTAEAALNYMLENAEEAMSQGAPLVCACLAIASTQPFSEFGAFIRAFSDATCRYAVPDEAIAGGMAQRGFIYSALINSYPDIPEGIRLPELCDFILARMPELHRRGMPKGSPARVAFNENVRGVCRVVAFPTGPRGRPKKAQKLGA